VSYALLIVGLLAGVAGWFSSSLYEDTRLDMQFCGAAMIVAGMVLDVVFGW
jgi:hypothetical protein